MYVFLLIILIVAIIIGLYTNTIENFFQPSSSSSLSPSSSSLSECPFFGSDSVNSLKYNNCYDYNYTTQAQTSKYISQSPLLNGSENNEQFVKQFNRLITPEQLNNFYSKDMKTLEKELYPAFPKVENQTDIDNQDLRDLDNNNPKLTYFKYDKPTDNSPVTSADFVKSRSPKKRVYFGNQLPLYGEDRLSIESKNERPPQIWDSNIDYKCCNTSNYSTSLGCICDNVGHKN